MSECRHVGKRGLDCDCPPDPSFRDTLAGDHWAGTPWEWAAKLARDILLAEPATWVVYHLAAEVEAQVQAATGQRAADSDTAVEDVRAIAVALGLGGHARPYSAHEVVRREILPALAQPAPADEAGQA